MVIHGCRFAYVSLRLYNFAKTYEGASWTPSCVSTQYNTVHGYGCIWVHMALLHMGVYSCMWLYRLVYGCAYHTAVYGCIWLYMVVYGCIRLHMVVHDCIWFYMAVHGCVRVYIALYCCIWLSMAVYGCIGLYRVV